jgi:acyl-CoA thioesterase YciA
VDKPALGKGGLVAETGKVAGARERMPQVSWKNGRTVLEAHEAMIHAQHPASVMAPPRLADGSELVMRVMPLPADTNSNGDIFGGWIMAQVDMAGAVLPSRVAKGRIATVAVNQFLFKQTVSVGDLLSFYARIERIGTTSVTVHVEVYAERDPANLQVVKVTEANLTYVAIDKNGRPRPLPRE